MKFKVGQKVSLKVSQSYLKTNDSMPMLRPADLVSLDEIGHVVALLPMDMVAVKYRRGTFILNTGHLSAVTNSQTTN